MLIRTPDDSLECSSQSRILMFANVLFESAIHLETSRHLPGGMILLARIKPFILEWQSEVLSVGNVSGYHPVTMRLILLLPFQQNPLQG